LARVGGLWAVSVECPGAVVSGARGTATSYAKPIWGELQTSRPEGIHFSLSLVDRGQNIAVQPVSSQGRVEAYLAVGKKEALTQFDRIVSSHAIGLLAIELAKVRAVSETERRLRGDAPGQILSGSLGPARTRRLLERLGFDLERPMAAIACGSSLSADELAEACEESMSRRAEAFLCSARDGIVVVVVQPEGEGFLTEFRTAVGDRTRDLMTGAGSLVPHGQLQQTVR